ncbi:F-box/kelch-repeat protein At3g23880-like [Lotus japonicus]|uniref:F-box/kelch-repeat protein At3g23880-like n=1 Tax=Lotus japonicus TaxID=34305 RepID=UPI002586F045|nr:F-box/kelch-repeat protein At3g23880-like [Lotus japonicus]
MVHTLGSNSWRKIEDFPGVPYQRGSDGGNFVSNAVNWLARDTAGIFSLDLGKETYEEFLQPDYGIEVDYKILDVTRDCLCILANSDFWVMKEYGNSESWTKLFSFSSNFLSRVPLDWYRFRKHHLLCVLENDESLVYPGCRNVYVYSHKNDTFRRSRLEKKIGLMKHRRLVIKDIYVEMESLISPW